MSKPSEPTPDERHGGAPAGREASGAAGRWRWVAVAAGAAVALSTSWYWLGAHRAGAPTESLTAVPLTSLPGVEIHPALSPDGERVAFVWDGPEGDNFDVYVKEIASGEMVRVTSDPAADYHPVWSPDGGHLAFLRRDGTGATVFLVPAAGGDERELAPVSALTRLYQQDLWSFWLDWSPDGRFLAVSERGADGQSWGIVLVSAETGEKRALTTTGNPRIVDRLPAFSPDGRTLAFLRGSFAPEAALLLLPLTSDATPEGPARTLATLGEPGTSTIGGLCWLPGGDELVVAGRRIALDGSSPRALHLPDRASDPRAGYRSPEQVSVRGGRLVFSTPELRVHLLRVPLTGGPNAGIDAFLPSTRGEQHAAFTPDGRRVAFCSGRSGDEHIWVCDVDGSACHELPLPQGSWYACSPSWSPDGRRLAFDAGLGERFHVHLWAPDDDTLRRLTSLETSDARPRWSRDGRSLYFASTRSGDFQIWKTGVDLSDPDAAAVRVTHHGGIEAEESPDGRYLYYAKRSTPGVWRQPLEGNGAEGEARFLDIGGEGRWCLGSRGIFVLDDRTGLPPTIRFVDFITQRASEVRTLPPEWSFIGFGGAFAVLPDGRWAVVTVERIAESDLMLVEGFQ